MIQERRLCLFNLFEFISGRECDGPMRTRVCIQSDLSLIIFYCFYRLLTFTQRSVTLKEGFEEQTLATYV